MKIKVYFLAILIAGLLIWVIYLHHQNTVAQTKFDTLNQHFIEYVKKDSLISEKLKIQQFKEDSYIRQQEHDTTLILLIIPLVFGIFAALSFIVSERRFIDFRVEQDAKHSEHIRKNNKLHDELFGLKAVLERELGLLKSEEAEKYSKSDISGYLVYKFMSLMYLANCCKYHLEHGHTEFTKPLLKGIEDTLEKVLTNISSSEVILTGLTPNDFIESFSAIRSLNVTKIDFLLAQVQAKMKFED